MILKTIGLSVELAQKTNVDKIIGNDDRADETVVNSSFQNSSYVSNIGATRKSNFLIPNTKKAFNYLKQEFIKALILRYFDLKSHIQIETDILGYTIDGVLAS